MPLTITPGQFSKRADFYHQLAQVTGVGLGIVRALEELGKHPPARSYAEPIRRLRGYLANGFTLSESLRQVGSWTPEFDIALLHAGEHSGRLDACFRLLSDYYTDRARITRQMISDLMYPALLFHMAVFILPFAAFFLSGDLLRYLLQTFGILIPVYGLLFLAIYAAQGSHGERWRALFEILLHPIPVLGTARRYLALARLTAALEALLNAGVTIIEAWELAASASGSPALRRAVVAWRPQVSGGETPAEVVSASGVFPDLFVSQYSTGELSGQLDDTLKRLRAYYQEEGSRKLHAVAQWTPRAFYFAVVILIAWRVVSFWLGHFRDIANAGGF